MKWDKIKYPFCLPYGDDGNILRIANFNHFIGYFGFDLMSYGGYPIGSYERLLFGKKSYNNTSNFYHGEYGENFPDRDHCMIFKTKGTKRIVLVNQPYQFDKKKLEDWCNERNLIYVECEEKYSFYAPKITKMVMVMSDETYIKLIENPEFVKFPRHWDGHKS